MALKLPSALSRRPGRPAQPPQPSVLIVLSQSPFDGDATWNAIRLAGTLVERRTPVRIFVMNDAIDVVRQGGIPEAAEFDLQAMIRALLPKGARLKICTTCLTRCGVGQGDVIPEGVMATMGDLAQWVIESDRVLVF